MTSPFKEPELDAVEIVAPGDVAKAIADVGGRMALRPVSEEGYEEDDLIQPLNLRIVDQEGTGELIRLQIDTLAGECLVSVIMKPDDLQDLLDIALTPVATG